METMEPGFELPLPVNLTYDDYQSTGSETESEVEPDDCSGSFGTVVRPPPSSSFDDYFDDTNVSAKSFIDFGLLKKQCIAFGDMIPSPVEDVKSIPGYNRDYLKRLIEKKLNIPLPVQAHLWPLLFRGRSATCVSASKTGKTLSYLIPALSDSQFKPSSDENLIYGDEGPKVVVVCSSRSKVDDVKEHASNLLDGAKYPRIISITQDNELTVQNRLLNGCELLISTPGPLKRLLEDKFVSFEVCSLLVFDDADRCFILHKNFIQWIVLAYFKANKKSLAPDGDLVSVLTAPILVLAESWTEEVKHFTKEYMMNVVTIFGDLFEAAISQGIPYHVHFLPSEAKRDSILSNVIYKILPRGTVNRIAIVCENDEGSEKVAKIMSDLDVEPVVIDGKKHNYEIENLVPKCRSHPRALTIITDEKIKEITQINFIDTLVHYNIPDLSKNTFNSRYLLMSKLIANKSPDISTHFILSSKNSHQASLLCQSLRRISPEIPKSLESLQNSRPRPLCEYFMAFGFCPFKATSCLNRHHFKTSEPVTKALPIDGELKFEITFVISANKFYLRLLEFRDSKNKEGKWIKSTHQMKDIDEELQSFKEAKRSETLKPTTGRIYGLCVLGIVHRVRISSIIGQAHIHDPTVYEDGTIPLALEVFFIDYGHKTRARSSDLIELPKRLKEYPALAFKAYLTGVKPVDDEMEWSYKATDALFSFVRDHRYITASAWIRLQRMNTFWLDRLKITQNLNYLGKTVVSWTPQHDLIDMGLAVKNEKLPPNANENIDELRLKWLCSKLSTMVSHAFLGKNGFELVYLSHFVSLDEFYVQKEGFLKILQDLEEDLAKTKLIPMKSFTENMLAIGHINIGCETSSYSRIMIKNICPADGKVEAFFVDWGETYRLSKEDCYYIDSKFITKLPFQAIKCSLVGVAGQVCPDTVYDFTREDEKYKHLLTNCVDGNPEIGYKVRLWVQTSLAEESREFTLLSKWLVDNKHAEYTDPEEVNQEAMKILKDDKSDEEEDDDDLDIWEKRCLENMLNPIGQAIDDYLKLNGKQDNVQFDPKKLSRQQKLVLSIKRMQYGKKSADEAQIKEKIKYSEENPPKYDYSQILPYDPTSDEESDLDNMDDLDAEDQY